MWLQGSWRSVLGQVARRSHVSMEAEPRQRCQRKQPLATQWRHIALLGHTEMVLSIALILALEDQKRAKCVVWAQPWSMKHGLSNLILKLQDEVLDILHRDSLTFPAPVYIWGSGEPAKLSPLEKRSACAGATLQCCLPSAETQLFPFSANSDSNWQRSRGTKRRSKFF